jgi:hypothetical protein
MSDFLINENVHIFVTSTDFQILNYFNLSKISQYFENTEHIKISEYFRNISFFNL